MKKKPASAKVVIQSLGKRTGNISAPAMAKVVREARSKFPAKKTGALRIKDTATGSGHIRFDCAAEKPKSERARRRAA